MAKAEPSRTSRFLSARALRVQPDGRLVALLRGGYDSAFDEIVRRYGRPLRNYAASIVTAQHADDVTQDAFTKAFLALRDTDKEIKLRPWLFRIVRNSALSDIRAEAPRSSLEAGEEIAGGSSPEEIAERREQIRRLMAGLRELPEPQRAAIVMRELEGLSHEQIASSLGLTGGAVRQSIYRARRALREGMGMLVPLPVLRVLLDQGFAQTASATAAGGGGGLAIKLGLTALLAAGTVTTGAALNGDLKPLAKADEQRAEAAGSQRSTLRGERSGSSEQSGEDHRGGGREGPGGGKGRDGHGGGESGRGGGGHEGSSSGTSSSGHGSGGSGSGSSGSGSDSSGPGSGGLLEPLDNSGPG